MPRLQFHPYSLALVAGAAVALAQAAVCWRRRGARGAGPLASTMVALAVWSATYAVHFAVTDAGAQLAWLNLMFVGVVLVPPCFLAFSHAFVGDSGWLTPRRAALLAVHPLLVLAAVWTNPWHGTFYSHIEQVAAGSYRELHWGRGWLYWVHVAYSYALVLAGAVLLAHTFRRAPQPYRRQVGLMLGGLGAGTGVAVVVYVRASPAAGADLTPLVFVACGLVLAHAIRVYGLFDVQPVARALVVERLRDAVLVLDARARVADANPAAARLLGVASPDALVGRPLAEACAGWQALTAALAGHDQAMRVRVPTPAAPVVAISAASADPALVVAGPAPFPRRRADDLTVAGPGCAADAAPGDNVPWFDVQVVPLTEAGSAGGATGERVLLFRDVSERRAAQRRLEAANAQLELQLAENHRLQEELRRLAETDALTGAANRRRLDQALPHAAAEASAAGRPLAVVMADIDHFKRVNDEHGHDVGDRLLAALAGILRGVVAEQGAPGADVFRYGGEEFVLVLPGATPERAHAVSEACRVRFAGVRAPADTGTSVGTTVSLGVAAAQPPYAPAPGRPAVDGAALLRAADRALYAAKAAGRNRVMTAGQGGAPPITAEVMVEAAG